MQKTLDSQHSQVISQMLVEIRKRAGFTQRVLAQRLEREHSFVAHYELGERRIDLAEFYWICKACNASPQAYASKIMGVFAELDKE